MASDPVSDPAFVAGMAETVSAMRELCRAAGDASGRHGHQPSARSVAMADIAREARYIAMWGDNWPTPVQDAHTFGGMTLTAATDFGLCYADLFDGERAPVYGHLALARAGLEACVVSSWLTDPRSDTEERLKRALCEQIYSGWEMRRLSIDEGQASANVGRYVGCAEKWVGMYDRLAVGSRR